MFRRDSQPTSSERLWRLAVGALFVLCICLPTSAQDGQSLLRQSGVQGGLVVHLGCGDGRLTAQLHPGEQYLVHGLDTSAANVTAARTRLREQGVCGPVNAAVWDGEHLPYADNLVNLIVAEDAAQATEDELLRVLAPNGVALVRDGQQWKKIMKPWPEGMDQWTHYFHDADGNPVAHDRFVAPPTQLRWLGGPRWSRHHDHMASMTSLVSAGGRLFYILDEGSRASIQLPAHWRLIARDAFNGTILWKRDIERWNTWQYPLKSGPAHLLRRLVAEGDRVYVTLDIDAPTTVLDAATGKTLMTYQGSRFTREILISQGVLFAVVDKGPSRLPAWRRVSTYVWENTRRANPGWGWQGEARSILAYKADSGKLLWKTDSPVAPCSLAVGASRAVFHDGNKLVCLDRQSGRTLWTSDEAPTSLPVQTNTGPRVLIYDDVVVFAGNNGKVSGWSLEDGRKLWEQKKRPSGHLSLKDLLVVDGLVWTGALANSQDSGTFTGYDPRTGEVKREFPADVKVHWFHHRCYPAKATDRYLLTARNGTEFVDLKTEHWKPHHWVRSGCIYGVMPANGLMYASMDACGCQLEAKLDGFKALASGPVPQPTDADRASRLQKGTAFGFSIDTGTAASDSDWPTYRHDAARSGASPVAVAAGDLGQAWQTKLGGRLSAPTIAAGKVFVAEVDAHTVNALDATTGKRLWSFTAGGRIDSPPTYYNGLALFGSADGCIYALQAEDGALVWRFRGAPVDRRRMAWEQLESAWPVHGSVLVHDGVVYCTAGRNMYLDGGIHFLRLDPQTGKLLGEVVWDDKDPETGEDMHLAYLKQTRGNNMPVALSDILSCDGRHLWMRSQKIDFDGNRSELALQDVSEQPADDCHLFCQVGFLDDSYFFRTYWTYGRRVTGGYGGWLKAGRLVPSGRILCFDDSHVYGFGRKPEFMTNSSVLQYQIFSADKTVTTEAIQRIGKAEAQMNARSSYRNANSSDWLLRHFFPREELSAVDFGWAVEQPAVTARAMALAKDTVFVAGPPNLIDERWTFRNPDSPEVQAAIRRQDEAMQGKRGGELWALSKTDGSLMARYALDSIPVFDGMAAAGGRLFVSTIDGRVTCLGPDAATRLNPVSDRPATIKWDQPEDPGYLLPPEVPKEGDFDFVRRCKVVEAELGYRLSSNAKGQPGIALKKLKTPATGSVTFTTKMKVAANTSGMLRNGFLAFGDGTVDAKLIKCGARLKLQKALLIQGPLAEGSTKTAAIDLPDGKVLDIVVTVDLASQKVTYAAGKVTLEASLERPLKSITHVGYAIENTRVEFAPVEVK